ncbi:MAG TPA: hypothetical protein DSN98_05100 [Thermoplasmata archaeon]|jgi:PAS domain S-box-containing protein|nr:MAG TPA: hypothetical protein DSN98_05100 [Thermoplasmata archaeon]
MTTIQKMEDAEQTNTNQELILGLTLDEEIIQFNKESERLTGYERAEVLHKKLFDILVPQESIEQWKKLLESIRHTMWIDNFVLPIKTKQNQTHMVNWTGFLVKDEHGSSKDICIFGKPLKTEAVKKQSSPVVTSVTSTQPTEQKIAVKTTEPILQQQRREKSMNYGRKKIKFAMEKKAEIEHTPAERQDQYTKPLVTIGKIVEKTSQKLDLMNESLKDLSRKYDAVSKRLGELEKKNSELEKKSKISDKPLQLIERNYTQPIREQSDPSLGAVSSDEQQPKDKDFTFFSDLFGFRRQYKELDERKQQLEIRSKELEGLQTQITNDRDTFNTRVEEFSRWREKLELLESAIEKRRQELMAQEDILIERVTAPGFQGTVRSSEQETPKRAESAVPMDNETLEKIPQSAAIIQRGILKQINTSFLEMLGYAMDEILEKSFFDFIALEGLADIEKYYLDRLKGDSVSVYKTVFSTKDDNKISVEVSIKQTIYNGEKAEIAIVTCLDPHPSYLTDEAVVENKQ